MNVGELKKMLEQYPDDMQIVNGRCSDYELISENEWGVVGGVPNDNGWIMRSHPTTSEEDKKKERKYLYLEGN